MLAIVQERFLQTAQDLGAGFEESLKLRFGNTLDVFMQMIDQSGDLLLEVGRVDRWVRRGFIDGRFHVGKGQILA